MTDEITVMDRAPVVELKRKKFFEPGTTIIAKVAAAEWVQGQFSPGVSVEYKTVSPEVGYSIRNTVWLSTRKADGEHFVRNYGPLDLIQRACLTDEEFFTQETVLPVTWVGRPVAFVLDEKTYEDEDGVEHQINIIKDGTTRRPTDEELAQIHKDLAGTGILAGSAPGKAELEPSESVVEDSADEDFESIPF